VIARPARRLPRPGSLVWPVMAVMLLHVSTFMTTLSSDEGGFAMLARWLSIPGDYLYNSMWVDRPPLLIGVFKVATWLGPHGTRVISLLLAAAMVAVLGTAGRVLGGARAGTWTAWIACGLAGSTMFATQELNGELIAATFISASVLATVYAVRGGRGWQWSAVAAGICATSAILVKQNFVDGLVFAGVFALLTLRHDTAFRGRVLRLIGWGAVGAAVPVTVALAWAAGHGGVGALFYAMYGFRVDASRLIGQTGGSAVAHRFHDMVEASLVTGLLPLALCVIVLAAKRIRRLDPLAVALLVTFAVELVGVLAGGNYWLHYLIGVFPTVALGAGMVASRAGLRAGVVKALGAVIVVSSVLTNPIGAVGTDGGSKVVAPVSHWLRTSSEPGDSLTTLYSHANINELSGLRPAYPYAWSLPLRVRDPQLTLLTSTLSGPHAPTWVLGWDDMHAWNLDQSGNATNALERHYRQVATVCGKAVWLHKGVTRHLATTPQLGEC